MAVQSSQQLSMDAATQGGFIKYFQSLAEKASTTIRLFDRNDYYTVHGEDATFTANEVFHTNSVIKYLGSGRNQLASVILSKPNFESFVRDLLLVKQYRVEIYSCKTKSLNNWKVAFKASPGNLQQLEDVLFGSLDVSTSLTIIAVKLVVENGKRVLGVAYAEPSSEELGVAEFIENDQFSNLEGMMVQLRPKECLLIAHDSNSDARKLQQILQRSGVLISERKRSEFSNNDIIQDLNRLLALQSGESSSNQSQLDLKHAMGSLSALIKYLELLSEESNFGAYKLSTFDFSQYLRLDNAAVKALNVEAQLGDIQAGGDLHTSHLSSILNHCGSAQGQRLLMQWLRQPLLDEKKIDERLDLVEIFFSDLFMRRSLQDCLKIVPDYFRLAKKLNKEKGSLQDCMRIYQSVVKLPTILTALSQYEGSKVQLLSNLVISPLKEVHSDFFNFIEMIEATVDMDMSDNHEYVIKPTFDEELTNLREQMDIIDTKIDVELNKASKELKLEINKSIKLEFAAQLGYYFRITKKYEKSLRGHPKYTIVEAHKDGVRFTTSSVDVLNEDYLTLKHKYTSTQATLVKEVLRISAGYTEPMLTLNHILAQLDVLISFAHASSIAPIVYVRPTILPLGTGDIILKGCRHPCLELQDDLSFISNDVSLLRGKENFQIITGPNMGGKSTYMRQIGVTVLMAQIGCYVPCTSAMVCVVDSILARVGAGDSQIKGISTFMGEMLETSSILKSATKHSLVIIDELGRGTSTYDGFGLAWAISEHIATKINCFCLFATHFHELTLLAEEIPTVKNVHVSALTTNDTLTLLYQVKPGVCDRSFGLHVAELAQFPSHVIDFAKKKVEELEIWNSHKVQGYVDGPPSKKVKLDKEAGEELITKYLAAVQDLSLSDKSDQDIESHWKTLKNDFIHTDNAYIMSILENV